MKNLLRVGLVKGIFYAILCLFLLAFHGLRVMLNYPEIPIFSAAIATLALGSLLMLGYHAWVNWPKGGRL